MSILDSKIVKDYLKDKEKLNNSFKELQVKYPFDASYSISEKNGQLFIVSAINIDSFPR